MAKHKTAGSAYLEALGVSLILVLLFSYALQFSRAAHAGLRQTREQRSSAWQKALAGCGPGKSQAVACNEPPRREPRAERDVTTFIAGMLAESRRP
jgi:hypothetical protein